MSTLLSAGASLRGVLRAAAWVLACAAGPVLASSNAVTNGGFEAGLSGWTSSGSVSVVTGSASEGLAAALLADDAASITWTLASALAVSDIADLSLSAQSDAGALSLVVLNYADGSSSGTDVLLFDLGNSDWARHSLTDQLAAGQSLVSFTVYGSSAAATLIDDVRLTTISSVPEPGAAALLAAGGAGLLAWRRRRPAAR